MAERRERVLDPRSLRALAHPLRVRMLGVLRAEGPATATVLADRFGERSGTTSWHLRALAEHGFVEEVPDMGTARERWWRSVHSATRIEALDPLEADDATRAALGTYLGEVLDIAVEQVATFLATESSWSREWREASTLSDYDLRLSPAEARELTQGVEALVEGFRRDARPGDEAFAVHLQAFPRRIGEGPP